MPRHRRRDSSVSPQSSAQDNGHALDFAGCMNMLQGQQQMLMTMLQEQQRLQSQLERENQELRQRNQLGSDQMAAGRVPVSSLPGKATYEMSMQQWRIWKRDIMEYAAMCRWDSKTTVMNIRLQSDDKLKRVIEAEYGDSWTELGTEQALAAVEVILRKASNQNIQRKRKVPQVETVARRVWQGICAPL